MPLETGAADEGIFHIFSKVRYQFLLFNQYVLKIITDAVIMIDTNGFISGIPHPKNYVAGQKKEVLGKHC